MNDKCKVVLSSVLVSQEESKYERGLIENAGFEFLFVPNENEEQFKKENHKDLFYKKENGKYQLNLWKANELVFLEAGIKPEHITMPGICTCCNPNFLFSHRASHGKRGNLAAFLGLRENQ